ncbi:hypothetical protein [Brevibacillus antibioticus]|uniref:hypothetical protein n=1 Tax=Brevibacillus antibioticus TaxID=2570228 RepID=UPI001FCAAE88|nr:hypothetical protein [Brevibacillus antibioticus]
MTHAAVIQSTAANAKVIKSAVTQAHAEITEKGKKANDNKVSSTDAYPVLERERSTAYLMPPGYHDIAAKLELLGVSIIKLSKETTIAVESYTILENKVNTIYENGHFTN